MKESTEKFLEKAFRSLQAAERLTKSGDAEFGVGRAYYAMFYAAEALLNEKGLRFRKHAGVHSAFAEQFVKSGLIDKRYHRWLLAGFSKRITADYGIEAELTLEDATLLIGQAREFLAAAKTFLEKKV
ncbi:MAG: HEPN domain-containing protein [Deltaproteobacteria bacterium]|nr:MAG: HEPN domain-containing protein [Deltaproteobacteria bacterium]